MPTVFYISDAAFKAFGGNNTRLLMYLAKKTACQTQKGDLCHAVKLSFSHRLQYDGSDMVRNGAYLTTLPRRQ